MKKRSLLMVLCFLSVATFAIAGGDRETVVTSREAEVGPQYGGTFTYLTQWSSEDPAGFDIVQSARPWVTMVRTNPYLEPLLTGDIEKYGPRGSGEYQFQIIGYVPDVFMGGELASSWELTTEPPGVIFHLREGVMWTGNDNIGMEPRELVAEDVVYHLKRHTTKPGFEARYAFVKSISAVDRYTVRVEFNQFDAMWSHWLTWKIFTLIMPRESVEAGGEDWRNAVGTGPFIISDYVEGSYISYKRNPDYWGRTTIDGEEYRLPFIEELSYPIVPDEATKLAALRTGTVDQWSNVSLEHKSSLESSSPGMIKSEYLSHAPFSIQLNIRNNKILQDLEIRRAMMIATDFEAIRDALFPEGDVHTAPFGRGTAEYTPLEEFPEPTRTLFDYNPDRAKQMIIAEGYPDGFDFELVCKNVEIQQDIAAMIAGMWEKVGINVDVKILDAAAADALWADRAYKGGIIGTSPSSNPFGTLMYGTSGFVGSGVNDPNFDAQVQKASATMDPVARTAILKKAGMYFLDNVFLISMPNPVKLNCYWPWVKNYYGEVDTGFYTAMPMISRLWIDEELKDDMGY